MNRGCTDGYVSSVSVICVFIRFKKKKKQQQTDWIVSKALWLRNVQSCLKKDVCSFWSDRAWTLHTCAICCVTDPKSAKALRHFFPFFSHASVFLYTQSHRQQLSGRERVLSVPAPLHSERFSQGSGCDWSGIMELRISIRLSNPHKYPSSRLPSLHGVRWSRLWCGGRGTVFPKSIIHTRARPEVSWTKSKELPTTCRNKQQSY